MFSFAPAQRGAHSKAAASAITAHRFNFE